MTEPTDDLRRAMAKAIMISPGRNWLDFADAAIAAYQQHPDGAAADRSEAAMLRDPAALHINLLRGNYLTREQLLHLGGEAAQIAVAEATARAEKAEAERDQLQRSFDLSYKSDMWAIERWQATHYAVRVQDWPEPEGDDMTTEKGLPIKGYTDQPTDKIARVNRHKELEERVLRALDDMQDVMLDAARSGKPSPFDPRWAAIAKTKIEQGFMALNRAVFQPQRVSLSEDEA